MSSHFLAKAARFLNFFAFCSHLAPRPAPGVSGAKPLSFYSILTSTPEFLINRIIFRPFLCPQTYPHYAISIKTTSLRNSGILIFDKK